MNFMSTSDVRIKNKKDLSGFDCGMAVATRWIKLMKKHLVNGTLEVSGEQEGGGKWNNLVTAMLCRKASQNSQQTDAKEGQVTAAEDCICFSILMCEC